MGKKLSHFVTGIACDHPGCTEHVDVYVSDSEQQLRPMLQGLAEKGWAFLTHGRLAAYCPEHAEDAFKCRCKTRVKRGVCPVHSGLPVEQVVIFKPTKSSREVA